MRAQMLRDAKLWRLNAELPSSPWGRSWVGPLSLLGVTATSAEALRKTNAECYFRVLPFFFFFFTKAKIFFRFILVNENG